ncbi:MAG TPA: hypothetical protein VHF22_07815 [Planctomycetota bacterium]|nr:hypothetical protein [Planctomycetota bacterium]
MGLVDTSYQPWDGARQGRLRRIAAMARIGIELSFEGLLTKMILVFAFSGVIVSLGFLFFVASLETPWPIALGNNLYHEYLNSVWYSSLIMLLTAMAGARLISRDLRYNAVSMYFSKGITRYDYLAGKFAVIATFLLSATWLPSLVLWVGQAGMGKEQITWAQRLGDLGALTGHALIIVVPASAAILGLSSLSRTAYVPGISWLLVYSGSEAVSGILRRSLRQEWTKLVGWQNLTAHLGRLLYESRPSPFEGMMRRPRGFYGAPLKYGWVEPAAILAGITVLSLGVVLWRLRKLEAQE